MAQIFHDLGESQGGTPWVVGAGAYGLCVTQERYSEGPIDAM
mgnify:CR=1 FL=1